MLDNPQEELQYITTSLTRMGKKGMECVRMWICMCMHGVSAYSKCVSKCAFPAKSPACNPEDKQQ